MGGPRKPILLAVGIFLSSATAATAVPIPESPLESGAEAFVGSAATPRPIRAKLPPRHPFMAPNQRSNIHNDGYQTDAYRWRGPLGRNMSRTSTFYAHECASITFDSEGRLVTICVGLERPFLAMLEPRTLNELARYDLPPRQPGGGNIFTDFSGGGYFYLDHRDRAVAPTTTRHLLVIGETDAPGFELQRDYDLSGVVPAGDGIISALPDWRGRIWFASKKGIVGYLLPASGEIRSRDLAEPIGNSFAVDETGGVFIVSDEALYRFQAGRGPMPKIAWRRRYHNDGTVKPGQTQAGSGTTPTVIGRRWIAITDNADPVHILVLKRRRGVKRRLVCRIPVFRKGSSSTDQSLIAINRSLVAANNFGYSVTSTMNGATTPAPGFERVRIRRGGRGCVKLWRSDERAPSAVPKLSLGAGLVYTYSKPPRNDDTDAWYFTAIDWRSGRTVYRRLAGTGFGYNNHYAPVTIGPDGTAYIGVLGGMVALRDTR
jgi:hypothetical protein